MKLGNYATRFAQTPTPPNHREWPDLWRVPMVAGGGWPINLVERNGGPFPGPWRAANPWPDGGTENGYRKWDETNPDGWYVVDFRKYPACWGWGSKNPWYNRGMGGRNEW